MSFVDLPISDRKLRGVAHAILKQGKNFSRSGFSETLTQGEYKKLRDAMAKRGLVVKRGNRTDLTDVGRETLGMILGES